MTDKKTFGSFIKAKRIEKNYSQKDLAELLFVTEGAVSKWERGVSYPDITLISDICRVLDISEHELVTASTDTEARKLKRDARKFRMIRSAWFFVPTISYAVALLTCFICNLAVNHTLSWFFIVFSALLCAYSFVPTFTGFFRTGKLLVFSLTTYLSLCLLLFVCAVYTNGLHWLLTACIGVLIGYSLIFIPIFLTGTSLSRCRFLLAFTAACALTVLLLLNSNLWHSFSIRPAILTTVYAYVPALLCTVICMLRFDPFLKASICTAVGAAAYYFMGHVVNTLFGLHENHYQVDFSDWGQCLQGNIHVIVLTSVLVVSAVFALIGILRSRRVGKE